MKIEELKVTNKNTIMSPYIETYSEDFLKEIEKLIKKDKEEKVGKVYFDKDKNAFIIHYYDTIYSLPLANIPKLYYDNTTLKLKELMLLTKKKDDEKEIIEKIENDEMLPNEKEQEIYLSYIKKDNKKNIFTIIKSSIISLFTISAIPIGIYLICLSLLSEMNLLQQILYGLLGMVITVFGGTVGIVNQLEAKITDFAKIKNAFKNLKVNNMKIKELAKKLTKRKITTKSINIEQFDKTLDDSVKEDLNSFTNQIMKNFNDLLIRVDYLNQEDKINLNRKIRELMNMYIRRYTKIISNSEKEKINLELDSLEKLKLDMTREISKIESQMNSVRDKDIKLEQLMKEKAILDSRMQQSEENNKEKRVTATR